MTASARLASLMVGIALAASAGPASADGPTVVGNPTGGSVANWRGWREMNDRNDLQPDAERNMDDRAREANDRAMNEADAYQRGANAAANNILFGMGMADNWNDFMEAFDALDPGDGQYDPGQLDGDGPSVPSSCAESPSCNACYQRAVGEIDFNRFYLQRAWSITHSTIDMAKKAQAFGNTTSGVHGVAGLAWQYYGNIPIEAELKKLRKTYHDKYLAYTRNLQAALQQLGQCEEQHFDERDWYGRFGYLYLNFMKAKYESPEP